MSTAISFNQWYRLRFGQIRPSERPSIPAAYKLWLELYGDEK